ncbi:MAG: hypothetical protein LBS07_06065 [Prevotellaceae bacterium]|jgi:hypothetical protein|nr:hypothetical protein [Prevotellaceae bacterium]
MQIYKNKLVLPVVALLLATAFSFGQNNTNSPYTRFGFGQISNNNSGEQRGMGGVSLGLRSPSVINTANPASYSAVDSLSFMFDVGLSSLASLFSDASGKKSTFNGNLEFITLQFPIGKWLGASAGLLPYSYSGYDFYNKDEGVQLDPSLPGDTTSVTRSYYGQGGISQVYAGLSFNLFNHVSLGVNAYYMFGNSVNARSILFSHDNSFSYQENRINVSDFRFRYGMQFFNTFAKKHTVNLGVIFEPKKALNAKTVSITGGVLTDTVTSTANQFDLPVHYGAGLAYTYDKRFTVGIDYTMQGWKDAKFFGKSDTLANCSKIAVGMEYIPDPAGRKFFEQIRYRAGLNLSDSYYYIKGTTLPKNIGITLGLGIPLPQAKTILNASVEYGKIGSNNLMNENYFKITFSATINEHWFFKRKL